MDKKAQLQQSRKQYFQTNDPDASLQEREKFKQSGQMEKLRDYWAVVRESDEAVILLHTTVKGKVDEFEVLQSMVDLPDNDTYYCYTISHDEYMNINDQMVQANKDSQPHTEGEPNLKPWKPTKDPQYSERVKRGKLTKKLGADYLKAEKLIKRTEPLGISVAEAMTEQPEIVTLGMANIAMSHRVNLPVGSRVEIAFKGTITTACRGRTVHLVHIAINEREGDFLYKKLAKFKVPHDFTGEFEMFAKDRIEREDQLYQVVIDAEVDGGTDCGISNRMLLVEEEETNEARQLKKGWFD